MSLPLSPLIVSFVEVPLSVSFNSVPSIVNPSESLTSKKLAINASEFPLFDCPFKFPDVFPAIYIVPFVLSDSSTLYASTAPIS